MGPSKGGAPKGGGPKFRAFFPFSPPLFSFFPLSLSLLGPFVEILVVFEAPGP